MIYTIKNITKLKEFIEDAFFEIFDLSNIDYSNFFISNKGFDKDYPYTIYYFNQINKIVDYVDDITREFKKELEELEK